MINVFSLFLAEINRKPYLSNDFKKIQLNRHETENILSR